MGASYGPALAHHAYGGVSYEARSPQGLRSYGYGHHGLYKRSADASYGPALAYHAYGGVSYEARSPQGLRSYGYGHHGLYKRSADASYGGHAYHPYGGSSYTYRSPQGLHGGYSHHGLYKRDADASYHHGYGGSASVRVYGADHHSYHPAEYNYGFDIHSHGK